MDETAAARLAASLRTAMKDQALNGAGLADRIERLTGSRPTPQWVSRRVGGSWRKAMIQVDPDLFVLAEALDINREDLTALIVDAVLGSVPGEIAEHDGFALTDKALAVLGQDGVS